ncbi:MAG: zf-TFIIB domain-containing protein [Acidimicrobiales bacterium]
MTCPSCHRSKLVEITLNLASHGVVFRACSSCGGRWWHDDGHLTALPRVLELVSAARAC